MVGAGAGGWAVATIEGEGVGAAGVVFREVGGIILFSFILSFVCFFLLLLSFVSVGD